MGFAAPPGPVIELGRVLLGMLDEGFRGMAGGAFDDGTIGVDGPRTVPGPLKGVFVMAILVCTCDGW